jgi:SAM-dependent methyltransferase
MPRIARTIIPRIRKSFRERGFIKSLSRSCLLPLHLLREYRSARNLRPDGFESEFDRAHGVKTDGELGGWTYLSDLDIASPNWIEGNDYTAIEPERFNRVLADLPIAFDEYSFVDFGSGKGRALLLASEFPFKRIIGLEFSPELHRIAGENISSYRSQTQKCVKIESLNIDFVDFVLPASPLVLFFYDPCRLPILEKVLARTRQSLVANPRPITVVYVAPRDEVARLFARADFLKEVSRNIELNLIVYSSLR